jgi:putative membrane protein
MNAMVKGHTEALNMIDTKLTQEVNNGDLKDHLEKTRHHVQMHLDKAKKIQASLS